MFNSFFSSSCLSKKFKKKCYNGITLDFFNILFLINEKLIYNIDKLILHIWFYTFSGMGKHKIISRCRRYRSAMSFIIFSFESKARSKSQLDLRRRISKYRKGRAFKGTRARKSRLVSRSTPMLFFPSSGLRHPYASRLEARTPTLVR